MSSLAWQGAVRLGSRTAGRIALLFLPAATFRWWQGWAYVALVSILEAFAAAMIIATDPALAKRRLKGGARAETRLTQKIIMALIGPLLALLLILAGLDHRFGWSRMPVAFVLLGDAFLVAALLWVFRVFRENSFASSVIGVSEEQHVITTGPYAWARHPMYSGVILFYFGAPLALGSWRALAVSVLLTILLVLRLLDEERLLLARLAGYASYCQVTRRRLFPGLW